MGFDEIVSMIVNNGVGVTCIVYFMFRDYHFMQKLTDTLASLTSALNELQNVTRLIDEERSKHDDNRGNETGINRLTR